MKIDETDRKIIALLQDDARQSNAAIARDIGVSEATIRRRIRMLVDDGTLAIRAIPNPNKFGLNTSALIGIDVQPDQLEDTAKSLEGREEVQYLAVSTGRYDLICFILVHTLEDLRTFLESYLSKVPGIRKTETLVVLDVKKRGAGRIG